MITIYNIKKVTKDNNIKFLTELRGLSTDSKPKTIENGIVENGSTFIEINTGKVFMYDLVSETWKEI